MATTLFQQLPWDGGLNLALDEAMIPTNQLTEADNVQMDAEGPRRKREGISHNFDDGETGTNILYGLHDYWFGSATRSQRLVGVDKNGAVYSYNAGARSALTIGGTAWASAITSVSMLTYNNKALIAVDGNDNVMKYWDGSGDVADVPGSPPKATFVSEHQGRIVCNDKLSRDLLHYSPTNDHTQWNGTADSGAIPIVPGDGDSEGIVAGISFRGDYYVFKRTKLYRIVGDAPETWQIVKLSDNIGCVGPNAVVPIGLEDVLWVSEKGVHSLALALANGDDSLVSSDIQPYFIDDLNKSRLKYIHARYLMDINSIALTVTEEASTGRVNTTNEVNNTLLLFNLKRRTWYRWPDISCASLAVVNDTDRRRFYIGTHTGRVSKSFNGLTYDVTAAGTQAAIKRRIVSGVIFVDQSPFTLKSFKRFVLYYKPKGRQTTAISFKVDGQSLPPENVLEFATTATASALGLGFKLGATPLGSAGVFAAYAKTVNGVGRGCKIIIEEASLNGSSDIEGFAIEFEPSGYFYEAE